MLHSEIVERRRWAKITECRSEKKRKTGGKAEAKKERSEDSNSESEEEEEEEEQEQHERAKGKKEDFSILTVKACANYKRDCKEAKWAKLRKVKKQAKQRWAAAAAGSGAMPRVQTQGDNSVCDFGCRNHPWAKIHNSHEAWFADQVAFCRICGPVNSEKGTMQRQCKGRPTRTKGKS